MNEPAALLSVADCVATITLNRPQRMNAFDEELHQTLRAAFDSVEANASIGAVILTGSGKAFCAGQDLRERAATFEAGGVPDLGSSLDTNYNPLMRRIAALPVPVIAAVNGIASGAGAAIAIGCDLVLAAQSARFQFAFAKIGLGPDAGSSWLLPKLVGQVRALGLALTAEPISATDAERFGLVWKVVPDTALADEAVAIGKNLAGNSRAALTAIKQRVRAAADLSFDQALDVERETQRELGRTDAYRSAVLGFAHKTASGGR